MGIKKAPVSYGQISLPKGRKRSFRGTTLITVTVTVSLLFESNNS